MLFLIAYQQYMSQDQSGPLGWPGWGLTRSVQHSFHSTGPARSLESEHSTASRLPRLLPWSHLLSGSKHPVDTDINTEHDKRLATCLTCVTGWRFSTNCAVIKAAIRWDYMRLFVLNTIPCKIRIPTWWLLQQNLVLWLAKERDQAHWGQTHVFTVQHNNNRNN